MVQKYSDKTVCDYSALNTSDRYAELGNRVLEHANSKRVLEEFKDANVDAEGAFNEDNLSPEDHAKYLELVMDEDEKWCRVREMVRDATGNETLWEC